MSWSFDDRYLAFLWNEYEDKGFDLWIYDTRDGKKTRVTSMDKMAEFDRDVLKAKKRYEEDEKLFEKREKMTEYQRREDRFEQEKKDKELKEPKPSYEGVREFAWANHAQELLLNFEGDLYRYKVGDHKLERLTRTREAEAQPKYTKDDKGFFFRQGDGVYRMTFGEAGVVQLNPRLPQNMSLGSYNISPDETKILLSSGRQTGQSRQVDYIVYRDRFAQARKTARDVADDPFRNEDYLFLYDLTEDPGDPKADGKPWEIFKNPGGKDYVANSVHDHPWSPDSNSLVFARFERAENKILIQVADYAKHEVRTIYEGANTGEHTSPSFVSPFFTPDGSKVVALLETSGFRQPWLIDPVTKGATQLVRGDFDLVPLAFSPDGKTLVARGSVDDLARTGLYKINMETYQLSNWTKQQGSYGEPELSHKVDKYALQFNSWSVRPELFVGDGKDEKAITASHRAGFEKVYKLRPELFSYQNRNGQTIHGYMYLPPGYDKSQKRPLYISVYGGPLGWGKSVVDGNISLFDQYIAYALGYIHAIIDPRGQSGYGAVFGKANYEQPGKPQVEDLTDGVEWFTKNYNIDRQKVGVSGWSFGGFQTQMCMYTAPDVFTLGIAGAGPTEWQNYNNWYSTGVIGPGDEKELDKFSLLYLAKNLRNPLMLLHGLEDLNVLAQDTIKVYRKLLQYGKGPYVTLVLDPTGDHGLGGDISTRDRLAMYVKFLLDHWGTFDHPVQTQP